MSDTRHKKLAVAKEKMKEAHKILEDLLLEEEVVLFNMDDDSPEYDMQEQTVQELTRIVDELKYGINSIGIYIL